MVAVSDFSGLINSAWAFARAQPKAATESLDRGMGNLPRAIDDIEADGAGFGALTPHAMADRLLDVLRYQSLELSLGLLVLQVGLPGAAEDAGKLRPAVGRSHIDNADRFDAGPGRIGVSWMRRFAGLHAAPELLLGSDQDAQVQRIHRDGDLDPLAAAGDN